MAYSSPEDQIMQRALQSIEQLLVEFRGAPEFETTQGLSEMPTVPFDSWKDSPQPARSAAYFCMSSASALLDVTRSLMTDLGSSRGSGSAAPWGELSALSKAAGQSAFLASVMLANGKGQGQIHAPQAVTAYLQFKEPGTARSSIAARLMKKLDRLFVGARGPSSVAR